MVTIDRLEASCREKESAFVVVVLSGTNSDRTLETIRRLRDGWAGELLVIGPATDPKLILRSIQAGANLFVDEADLDAQMGAALERMQARRGAAEGQLLAVLSASGGCGASTLAVNLAALLAKARGRCNLIDLNPGKADLAPLLDLKPQYTLADLCRHEDRLDRTLFEKLLTTHASGIELLAAPRLFDDLHSITAGGVAGAIELAQAAFADVVVDLEDCFHEEQMAVLERATRVLLVCRLDFTAIRNTRRALDHLVARGVARERIEVVVNHAGLPNELPVAEAEIALGCQLTRFVPHDPETVGWSNNTGIPAAIKSPEAAVVQGIARLVGLDTPLPIGPPPLVRFRNWFRSRVAAPLIAEWRKHTSAPVPAALQLPEQETKTSHESLPDTITVDPDSRACAARAG